MYQTITEALEHTVRSGRLAELAPGLTPVQTAMVMLWVGGAETIQPSAELIADHMIDGQSGDVPRQWLIDAVLFNSGHRALMKSIPTVAAEMMVSINGSPHAFTVMWDVGERLEKQIARPTWDAVKLAFKKSNLIK